MSWWGWASGVMLACALAAPAWAQSRHALVVGNGAYADVERLDNPVADATAVAAALRDVGFEVTVLTDAGLKDLERAVDTFVDRLDDAGKDAVGLFYFAGHGVQMSGLNWLIPVDAEISRAASLKYEAVSAQQVLDLMAEARNNTDIVVLDACRNDPYRGRFMGSGTRSIQRGLAEMSAPEGSFLIYSTSPGRIAYDGTGDLSPFAAAFTAELSTPGRSVGDMMVAVRRRVRDETRAMGDPQVPWTASSLMGRFDFVPGERGLEPLSDAELPRPEPVGPDAMDNPLPVPTEGGLPRCGEDVRKRRRARRVAGLVTAGVGAAAAGVAAAVDPPDFDFSGASDVVVLGGGATAVVGVLWAWSPWARKPADCAW